MSGYGGWTPQEPEGGWRPQEPGGAWTPQPEPEPTVVLGRPSRWAGLRDRLPGSGRKNRDGAGDGYGGDGYGQGPGGYGQGPGQSPGQGPGEGGPRPPKVRRFSWPKRILAGAVVLVLLVGGYATWLYFHASGEIRHENVISDYAGRPAQGKGTNWLLVGSDSRAGLTRDQQDLLHTGTGAVTGDTQRTDSMMILHSGSNGTSLISLPRDSYVTIPAWTDSKGKQHKESKNKLNAAYAFGGSPLLIRTIEVTTGVHIDHFAEVGFGGFVKVTDAVGGVGLCLDKPIKDELSGADLKAGCQTLNGAQALAYVRERYADPLGDIGRMQRQRAFLAALAHKVSSAGVILNPFKLVPVLDDSLAAFQVSDGTSLGDLYDMFQNMKGVSGGSGHTIVVPIATDNYNVPGVGSSILWNKEKAAQLWGAVINDTPMPAFSATGS